MDFQKDGNRRALNQSIASYNMDQIQTYQQKKNNEKHDKKNYKDSLDSLIVDQNDHMKNKKNNFRVIHKEIDRLNNDLASNKSSPYIHNPSKD